MEVFAFLRADDFFATDGAAGGAFAWVGTLLFAGYEGFH